MAWRELFRAVKFNDGSSGAFSGSGDLSGIKGGLSLEGLEGRVLLSVTDLADVVIAEAEPNDSADEAQLLPVDVGSDVLAVGVTGDLSSSGDVDVYGFDVSAGAEVSMQFELLDVADVSIGALAGADDDLAYFVAG